MRFGCCKTSTTVLLLPIPLTTHLVRKPGTSRSFAMGIPQQPPRSSRDSMDSDSNSDIGHDALITRDVPVLSGCPLELEGVLVLVPSCRGRIAGLTLDPDVRLCAACTDLVETTAGINSDSEDSHGSSECDTKHEDCDMKHHDGCVETLEREASSCRLCAIFASHLRPRLKLESGEDSQVYSVTVTGQNYRIYDIHTAGSGRQKFPILRFRLLESFMAYRRLPWPPNFEASGHIWQRGARLPHS